MAGPFELRRPAAPMPGPSTPQPAPVRTDVPAAGGNDRFLEMLREVGLGQDRPAPSAPPPQAPQPQVFQGLSGIGGQPFAREPIMPRPPESVAPPVEEPPVPPAEFKPGEPGAPKSGLTVHQLAKDEGLQAAVGKWFKDTGKATIKGPDLMNLLKERAGMEMSVRQAAGLAKRLTQAETLRREDPSRDARMKGAAMAMKKA
jgi:hypothetical protein